MFKILLVVFLFFLSFNANTNECLDLQNALKDNAFWDTPTEKKIGYGFKPQYNWDETTNQFIFDIDEIGLKIQNIVPNSPSFEVALLGKAKLYENNDEEYENLINENIRITHINEKEIKSLLEEEIHNLFSSDSVGKKIVLTIFDTEKNLTLKKTLRSEEISVPPDISVDFRINDFLNVNPKNMEYTVKYYLNYYWSDNRWLEIAKQSGLGEEGNASSCVFKKENMDLNIYQYWEPLLYFTNKASVIDSSYNKPKRDDLVITLDENEDIWFDRIIEETAVFNSLMHFRDFPFDSHQIYFELT